MERPQHARTHNVPSGQRQRPGQTDGQQLENKCYQTKSRLWSRDQQPESAQTGARLLRSSLSDGGAQGVQAQVRGHLRWGHMATSGQDHMNHGWLPVHWGLYHLLPLKCLSPSLSHVVAWRLDGKGVSSDLRASAWASDLGQPVSPRLQCRSKVGLGVTSQQSAGVTEAQIIVTTVLRGHSQGRSCYS